MFCYLNPPCSALVGHRLSVLCKCYYGNGTILNKFSTHQSIKQTIHRPQGCSVSGYQYDWIYLIVSMCRYFQSTCSVLGAGVAHHQDQWEISQWVVTRGAEKERKTRKSSALFRRGEKRCSLLNALGHSVINMLFLIEKVNKKVGLPHSKAHTDE